MAEEKPVSDGESSELKLLKQEIKGESEVIRTRIEGHNKRCDDVLRSVELSRVQVDQRTALFGKGMMFGTFIGLVGLFIALYFSMTPVVSAIVTKAAEQIPWDERIELAASKELELRLNDAALDAAIDSEAIEEAAAQVVQSPKFQAMIDSQIEIAAKGAVTKAVDDVVEKSNVFELMVKRQVDAQRERLQAATAEHFPIEAKDKDELIQKLRTKVLEYKSLGEDYMAFTIWPYDDSLHVYYQVWWRQASDHPLRIIEWRLKGTNSTTAERNAIVEKYLGQSVPNGAMIVRASEGQDRMFSVGNVVEDEKNYMFGNYEEVADVIATDSVALVEDCFGIEYPTTWRIKLQ